jgi:integrase
MKSLVISMGRVERFLDTFGSESTKTAYRWALRLFFDSVYARAAKESAEEDLDGLADRYFTEARNYKADMAKFLSTIKGRPPKSVGLALSTVRTFMMENEVEIPDLFWRRLRRRRKGARALTIDRVPTNLQLRKILEHMPIQGRALFLVLSSSGMRIGETLKLEVADLQLDTDPARADIHGNDSKSGNSRIAFVSSEAKNATEEWLKVRKEYIEAAVLKSHLNKKSNRDNRLFPFASSTASLIWRNALRKADLLEKDRSTDRLTFHPHVLRKFFRTRMGTVIPQDVVEALIGWEGQLRAVYRRFTAEQLGEFYKAGEASVLLFSNTEEDLSRMRKEFKLKSEGLEEALGNVVGENANLRNQLGTLKKRVVESEHLMKLAEWQVNWVKTLHDVLPNYVNSLSNLDEKTKAEVIRAWQPFMNIDIKKISPLIEEAQNPAGMP